MLDLKASRLIFSVATPSILTLPVVGTMRSIANAYNGELESTPELAVLD